MALNSSHKVFKKALQLKADNFWNKCRNVHLKMFINSSCWVMTQKLVSSKDETRAHDDEKGHGNSDRVDDRSVEEHNTDEASGDDDGSEQERADDLVGDDPLRPRRWRRLHLMHPDIAISGP